MYGGHLFCSGEKKKEEEKKALQDTTKAFIENFAVAF